MMHLIWYNPDKEIYEQGSQEEYERMKAASFNEDGFNVLYEFKSQSKNIADKIIRSLNIVRGSGEMDNLPEIEDEELL